MHFILPFDAIVHFATIYCDLDLFVVPWEKNKSKMKPEKHSEIPSSKDRSGYCWCSVKKKCSFKISQSFTGKHLCHSLFFDRELRHEKAKLAIRENKLQRRSLSTILFSLQDVENSKKKGKRKFENCFLFLRTNLKVRVWTLKKYAKYGFLMNFE